MRKPSNEDTTPEHDPRQLDIFRLPPPARALPVSVSIAPPLPAPLPPPVRGPTILPSLHPPYQAKSATSVEAAESIRPNANRLRQKIYEALVKAGPHGMTHDEMVFQLKMKLQTVVPRRLELVQLGKVVDSGITRLTSSRRKAAVWIAAEYDHAERT